MATSKHSSHESLLRAFEDGSLPAESFHHGEHLRVAWYLLRGGDPAAAMERFVEGLKAFAAAKGAHGLYHETITLFYLHEIKARIARSPDAEWAEFQRRNADLFVPHRRLLDRHYSTALLDSSLARQHFVLPDLLVYPAAIPVTFSESESA